MKAEKINFVTLKKFNSGHNFTSYRFMGAHFTKEKGKSGVRFVLWAPNAREVSVVGDFNGWDGLLHKMDAYGDTGIWHIFIPNIKNEALYKYEIVTNNGEKILKADPYAFYTECRPNTASKVYSLEGYNWTDEEWQNNKNTASPYNKPMLIYEVHLGSWRQTENNELLTYRELAETLVNYVVDLGYTHIELLPLAEHPFDGSWGYQVTGYYSITSRYGTPKDFMYFVDTCHAKGIGVIIDWVPAHFCKDSQGLRQFDGSCLYENENPIISENYEWGTLKFDFSKKQVWSFLISNAYFYFDLFHIDGLRVDAVASILYLDYGRKPNCWIPNKYGGREDLDAVNFIKKLNEVIFKAFQSALMIAEESTTWPMVTAPTYVGGLGFNYKWNMGWMNDILKYMQLDPIHRKWHHNSLTFSFTYTYTENYILPLSHDEVVHGKKSLLNKMSGDYSQKFANLRAFYAFMMAHPGKKLMFMGGEFGQFIEWRDNASLDWLLLNYETHQKLLHYVKTLNYFYKNHKALWQQDHCHQGLKFIDGNDYNNSVITFLRKGLDDDFIIAICNFTPVVHENYRIGVPVHGIYEEIFNSDNEAFGGSDQKNNNELISTCSNWHSEPYSLEVKLPPLATIYLKLSKKIEPISLLSEIEE